jgi:hypothetical protein
VAKVRVFVGTMDCAPTIEAPDEVEMIGYTGEDQSHNYLRATPERRAAPRLLAACRTAKTRLERVIDPRKHWDAFLIDALEQAIAAAEGRFDPPGPGG